MSGTAQTFTAIVTAQDQITQALTAINARMREIIGTQALAGQSATTLNRANDLARRGFSALHDSVGPIAARIRGVTTSIAGLVAAAAGIGGLGLGAGILALARNSGEVAAQIEALHTTLGVSREQLHLLSFSAQQGGTSLEAMTDPLTRLRDTLAQVARGGAPEAARVMRELGISVRNADGSLRPITALVADVGRAFESNTDQASRSRIAMALLGTTNEQVMATFGRLRRSATAFREAGGGLTEAEYARLRQYREAWNALSGQLERVRDLFGALAQRGAAIVGASIAPALQQAAERFTALIDANRELIATRVSDWANQLSTALSGIDWAGVGQSIDRIAAGARDMLDVVGGIGNALRVVGVVIAAAFAAPVVTAIAAVATALGGPLTLALGAVTVAGVAIYRNWDAIRDAGVAVGQTLTGVFTRLGQFLTDHLLGPLTRLRDGLQSVLNLVPALRIPPIPPAPAPSPPVRLYPGGIVPPGEAPASLPGGVVPPRAGPASLPGGASSPGTSSSVASLPQLRGGNGAGAVNGQVEVVVRLPDAPPGTTASATTRGEGVATPSLDVGRSMAGAGR